MMCGIALTPQKVAVMICFLFCWDISLSPQHCRLQRGGGKGKKGTHELIHLLWCFCKVNPQTLTSAGTWVGQFWREVDREREGGLLLNLAISWIIVLSTSNRTLAKIRLFWHCPTNLRIQWPDARLLHSSLCWVIEPLLVAVLESFY